MQIHLAREAQIALLKANEILIIVPAEYSDFSNIFSEKHAVVLPEYTKINTHTIDLKEDK